MKFLFIIGIVTFVVGIIENLYGAALIGLAMFFFSVVVIRGQKIRANEDIIRGKNIVKEIDKNLNRKKTKTNSSSIPEKNKIHEELDNSNSPKQNEFVAFNAALISTNVDTQLSLLTHIDDVKENDFTIGYIFGFLDGVLQLNNLEVNNDVSFQILELIFKSQFSKNQAVNALSIYENQSKKTESLLMQGQKSGGEDAFNLIRNNTIPMGLCAYFDNDNGLLEVETSDHIEERLETLSKLYEKRLITKKTYEDKQAEILSEL